MPNHHQQKQGIEILCIGTELLLGDILNSNARWIAKELASLGLPHFLQTVVGDNSIRLQQVVLQASSRSKILITTGGLGPTPDDLTTETLSATFQTPLEERLEAWIDIQEKTSTNNQNCALSNRKQALFPVGAKIIPNPSGTAPGMIWQPVHDFTILTFPGVPSELKQMWTQTAVPWLRKHGGSNKTLISRVLKVSGIPESILSEDLADLFKSKNPTVAPYASLGEVKIRLTAKASSVKEAERLLVPLEEKLRQKTGLKCYGVDNESLSSVVLDLLRQRRETLAIAESCTGGGLGAELSAVPGASDVFIGGVIAYSNSIKQKLLGIPATLINKHGAVSHQVAQAMAMKTRENLGSDWAIAISGLAGPNGGSQSKPIGFVQIAVAGPQNCETYLKRFGTHRGRIEIQKLSVLYGLDQLRLLLLTGG